MPESLERARDRSSVSWPSSLGKPPSHGLVSSDPCLPGGLILHKETAQVSNQEKPPRDALKLVFISFQENCSHRGEEVSSHARSPRRSRSPRPTFCSKQIGTDAGAAVIGRDLHSAAGFSAVTSPQPSPLSGTPRSQDSTRLLEPQLCTWHGTQLCTRTRAPGTRSSPQGRAAGRQR